VRKTSISGSKMTEKKRRQGQIKPGSKQAVPKPVCPKCGEIMVRAYIRGNIESNRAYIGSGWMCPSSTCEYIIKDFVELEGMEEESNITGNVKGFAEACCDQNSLKELKNALAGKEDETDMKTWSLTEDQWCKAIEVAIIAMEHNLSVDEAIKCISFS
jgi:hypothetical protein